jgi:hypothetical protein
MNTFKVWCPALDETEKEAQHVKAEEPATAAETWAEKKENLPVHKKFCPIVHVRSEENGAMHSFRLHSAVLHYVKPLSPTLTTEPANMAESCAEREGRQSHKERSP